MKKLLKWDLLGYEYFIKHYKLIVIDLSRQIELENPDLKQKINFIDRLDEDKATMFFLIKKSEHAIFEFSHNSVTVVWLGLVRDYTQNENLKGCKFI